MGLQTPRRSRGLQSAGRREAEKKQQPFCPAFLPWGWGARGRRGRSSMDWPRVLPDPKSWGLYFLSEWPPGLCARGSTWEDAPPLCRENGVKTG